MESASDFVSNHKFGALVAGLVGVFALVWWWTTRSGPGGNNQATQGVYYGNPPEIFSFSIFPQTSGVSVGGGTATPPDAGQQPAVVGSSGSQGVATVTRVVTAAVAGAGAGAGAGTLPPRITPNPNPVGQIGPKPGSVAALPFQPIPVTKVPMYPPSYYVVPPSDARMGYTPPPVTPAAASPAPFFRPGAGNRSYN